MKAVSVISPLSGELAYHAYLRFSKLKLSTIFTCVIVVNDTQITSATRGSLGQRAVDSRENPRIDIHQGTH